MPSNGYKCPEKVKKIFQKLDPKNLYKKMILKPISQRKTKTFLQSTYVTASIIQFVIQNFPWNCNKSTSYLHIKISKLSKANYRPISILPNVSKSYERCLYDQITTYFEHMFSRYQCDFCKGYSTQHCLLVMIEKWKKVVDNGGVLGVLLTDLSKVFDCILNDLIIAKLEAYGFHIDALKLIHDYLSNRKQRVSSWKDIFYGVPQGSIPGVCVLFYFFRRLRHCKLCG